ncbi:MAG: hypothetical protein HY698_21475 [Deltaproteobacteria bacterium]|nr:hypothetical protein [Deltaproteobacteria bacterium]
MGRAIRFSKLGQADLKRILVIATAPAAAGFQVRFRFRVAYVKDRTHASLTQHCLDFVSLVNFSTDDPTVNIKRRAGGGLIRALVRHHRQIVSGCDVGVGSFLSHFTHWCI